MPENRTTVIGVQINDTDPDKLRAAIEYAIRTAYWEAFESANPSTDETWTRMNFEDWQRTAAYESLINSAIARIR